MNFKDAQFAYDYMSENEYPDEGNYEQDYEPDLEEDEDLNAECVW